ncbi:MAG: DUF5597 domain-containing protein [Prevotella sp.]|nr:DUF5597 domain-containing protein [Prevotella sp.]
MKKTFFLLLTAFCLLHTQAFAKVWLRHQGTATQLMVNNQPMLILGGELSNSAATSKADIDSVLPRMKALGLNTVFLPAYWDLMEPREGQFDFSLIDEAIQTARQNNLKLVYLWFGAWKNSMSCYAPLWFKQDTKRFPRAQTANGKPLEIATAFSENVLKADKRAFLRLVEHIKEVDSQHNTVIMLQVENEIGMLESARDFSPLAEKAYRSKVPENLLKHLGIAKRGTWPEVFGDDLYAQEKFQAYYYAAYVQQLCAAAKATYALPLYVNAAMNSRGRKPGEYPSAGPLAHLIEIWKCAAPDIDIFAPDIYDTGFKDWVEKYKLKNNPFFTPETRLSANSGVRALYTFGAADAMSFSPFAIDEADAASAANVSRAYTLIRQLQPLLIKAQGMGPGAPKGPWGKTWGLLFDQNDREQVITDGDVILTCRHYYTLPWDPRATDGTPWPEGGGLILKLGTDDYLIAGNGIVTVFQTAEEKKQEVQVTRGEDGFAQQGKDAATATASRFRGQRIGIGYVDQVEVAADGTLRFIRRDNGDQDHQGRHARISCGDYKILHVKLYRY